MTTRVQAPVGAPCWVDYSTSDVAMARKFYTEVFGWTAGEQDAQFGGYFQFFLDGVPVAGCAPNVSNGHQPDVWSVYLKTPNAKETISRATKSGGAVVVPEMQVGELGTMAVITDVSGASIGLWEPMSFHGFGRYDEAATPKWFELMTKDYTTTVDFYKNVFDWTTMVASDTPDFKYTTEVAGSENLAGVMDASKILTESMPSSWSVYFGVHSVDATIEAVTRCGGTVIRAAEDTPFGRLATVADPSGAQFKIMESQ